MKHLLLLCATLITLKGVTQYSYSFLDENNTKAYVGNGGIFLNNASLSAGGFGFPLSSGNSLIYSSAFWFGGENSDGQLMLSAQMYNPGDDLFRGAITADGTASAPTSPFAGELYIVTKAEVDNHIANYMNAGYDVPNSFIDWPAHGDVSQNLDFYLAPFVDVNNDGIYNPELGDYPDIRGDKTIYLIMNDKTNVHSGSGGAPLGIECHFMFYQFNTTGYLGNTTFVNVKVINRSSITIQNFRTGLFVDPDLGDYADDFIGCDSAKNLMYCYNSDNFDNVYGNNPPALGIANLNNDLAVFGSFANAGVMGTPNLASDYWKYMNGLWLDSSPFTHGGNGYGGTQPTKFLYNGNPNDNATWSEISNSNMSGDRRMFMSTSPTTLLPNQEICFDFAFFGAMEGNNLENVDALISTSDSLNTFFNEQNFSCNYSENLGDYEYSAEEFFAVYPNPIEGEFFLNLPGEFEITIYSMDGKIVYQQKHPEGINPIRAELKPGTYVLHAGEDFKTFRTKIVVR